jgi:hypothetical protein
MNIVESLVWFLTHRFSRGGQTLQPSYGDIMHYHQDKMNKNYAFLYWKAVCHLYLELFNKMNSAVIIHFYKNIKRVPFIVRIKIPIYFSSLLGLFMQLNLQVILNWSNIKGIAQEVGIHGSPFKVVVGESDHGEDQPHCPCWWWLEHVHLQKEAVALRVKKYWILFDWQTAYHSSSKLILSWRKINSTTIDTNAREVSYQITRQS